MRWRLSIIRLDINLVHGQSIRKAALMVALALGLGILIGLAVGLVVWGVRRA